MTLYRDDAISMDDRGITIESYHLPGRPRHVPFGDIAGAELIPLGFFTGRHQLVGIGPFRPRLFFHWDRKRATRTHAIEIDRGTSLHLAITPSEPERALEIIRRRIEPS